MKNEKIAIIDLRYVTIELCNDMAEVMEVMDRFKDDIEEFTNKMVVSEEKMLDMFATEKITIVNYFDNVSKVFYEELTYNEYRIIEEKNYMLTRRVKDDGKAYSNIKRQLNEVVGNFLDMEDEEEKFEYIDKQYVTIGVNGKNYNFDICADLYNELDALLGYMEELS